MRVGIVLGARRSQASIPMGVLVVLACHLGAAAAVRADEPGNVVTVGGTGPYIGDGGSPTTADLNLPEGVAVDPAGNLYIADANNNRIRRVDAATNVITTVAGSDLVGYSGDGGPATQARLKSPSDVAIDARSGDLYFTDASNDCVRRVEAATGKITTVAGTGTRGYSGDGGPATSARLANPRAIALSHEASGLSIYFCELLNAVVRKVDGNGYITTVAGTGVPSKSIDGGLAIATALNLPFGLGMDATGNLYIGEGGSGSSASHRVRRVDAATGIITTIAGFAGTPGFTGDGGPATAATLNSPRDIAFDATTGLLFVVDNGNARIRAINPTDATVSFGTLSIGAGTIATVAGNGGNGFSGDGGPATAARLAGPFFVDVDSSGNLYIGDRGNNRVRRVDHASGNITTVAGGFVPLSGEGGPATATFIGNPAGLAFDRWGNLYLVENGANRVRRIDGVSGAITTIVGTGEAGFSGDGGPAGAAQLHEPQAVALDGAGNLYIADAGNSCVRFVNLSSDDVMLPQQTVHAGQIATIAGTGVSGFAGDGGPAITAQLSASFRAIALDASGNLWIADSVNGRVRFVNQSSATVNVAGQAVPSGFIATIAGTTVGGVSLGFSGDAGPATSALLNLTSGLAFDPAGNLYLGDSGNNRLRFVNLSDSTVAVHGQAVAPGAIVTIAGTRTQGSAGDGGPASLAQLFGIQGVVVDASGSVYLADTNNNRVRRIDGATGVITTVAGSGMPGFTGDGGAGPQAAVNNPRYVTLGPSGNLHVTEFAGCRIRRLNVALSSTSAVKSGGKVLASITLPATRAETSLPAVWIVPIDPVLGLPLLQEVFPGTDLGPDPADPTNPRKRVFSFGSDPRLLAGEAFRVEGRFASDGKLFSGDALYSLAWDPPAAIVQGTALGATQLDATATIGGTFVYSLADGLTPAAGALLAHGPGQLLFVTFTPDDPTRAPATASVAIDVYWSWSGVLSPLNANGVTVARFGPTLPVKFQLTGASAGNTSVVADLYVAQVTNGVVGPEQPAPSATRVSQFRYDVTKDQYVFNLDTSQLSPGTWRLRIDLHDGAQRTVSITLR
jgi:sugar lactone lactonase YvrE